MSLEILTYRIKNPILCIPKKKPWIYWSLYGYRTSCCTETQLQGSESLFVGKQLKEKLLQGCFFSSWSHQIELMPWKGVIGAHKQSNISSNNIAGNLCGLKEAPALSFLISFYLLRDLGKGQAVAVVTVIQACCWSRPFTGTIHFNLAFFNGHGWQWWKGRKSGANMICAVFVRWLELAELL